MLSYQNSFYDYQNSGALVTPPLNIGTISNPVYISNTGESVQTSYAGLLNRVEQPSGWIYSGPFRRPRRLLLVIKFGLVNFTGNEPIAIYVPISNHFNIKDVLQRQPRQPVALRVCGRAAQIFGKPDRKRQRGRAIHRILQRSKLHQFVGAFYADASLIYTYASGSYAQLGLTQSRNATDTVEDPDSQGHITQDQESTVVYGSINNTLTPKLMGSFIQDIFQYSTYNQGAYDSRSAEFYNLGLNLSYAFNRHLSSDVGYNFDYYTTAVPGQDFTRNRVYLGVTASY